MPRSWLAAAGAIALTAVAARAGIAQNCHPRGGAVVLTVAGEVGSPNRAGNTPVDQFTNHQDHHFNSGHSFSYDDLGGLPQIELRMVLPYDGKTYSFSGPSLDAILQMAGAWHAGVTVAGIDGYHVDFSSTDVATLKPVLALCRDGFALGIGDLGPGFLIYKPKEGPPNDQEFARMVWGVYWMTPLPPEAPQPEHAK